MLDGPRGPLRFALNGTDRNTAMRDVPSFEHSIRTDSACDEIQKRNGTLGQPD